MSTPRRSWPRSRAAPMIATGRRSLALLTARKGTVPATLMAGDRSVRAERLSKRFGRLSRRGRAGADRSAAQLLSRLGGAGVLIVYVTGLGTAGRVLTPRRDVPGVTTGRVPAACSGAWRWRLLVVGGPEGVPEVVFRDVTAEDHTGDAREVVVQPAQSRASTISWRRSFGASKCRTASRFPAGPPGSKPWISRSIWFVPIQGGAQRIGADEVDHRHNPRCLEQVGPRAKVAPDAGVLATELSYP